ncbi:hypothetical protein MAMT_01707 [Methylacidimicrobium tartarophylax]|uniref:Uncharacterized protein n=1 Tax=Methylacidimicrobium tartarophylax TaxID=1041768 RepID=A0A5E6MG79_9BACT|nr:hypothetical protein MAMT_01707 [Methylacidimicrobium tartarophylax]
MPTCATGPDRPLGSVGCEGSPFAGSFEVVFGRLESGAILAERFFEDLSESYRVQLPPSPGCGRSLRDQPALPDRSASHVDASPFTRMPALLFFPRDNNGLRFFHTSSASALPVSRLCSAFMFLRACLLGSPAFLAFSPRDFDHRRCHQQPLRVLPAGAIVARWRSLPPHWAMHPVHGAQEMAANLARQKDGQRLPKLPALANRRFPQSRKGDVGSSRLAHVNQREGLKFRNVCVGCWHSSLPAGFWAVQKTVLITSFSPLYGQDIKRSSAIQDSSPA